MVTGGIFSLFLKLCVFIVKVVVNDNTAMSMMNDTLVASQLILSPQWDDEIQSCSLEENRRDGRVLFRGTSEHFCNLQVVSLEGAYIHLQPLLDSKNNSLGHPLMYIERNQNLSFCENKYLVFEEQNEVCNLIFVHTNIQIILQGNARILLAAIPSLNLSIQCPESNTQLINNDKKVNQTTYCKNVKGFMKKITCGPSYFDTCNLNVNEACKVTVSQRKVIYQCNNLTVPPAIIIYTPRITGLNLENKGIIEIKSKSFLGLRDLQILNLYNNDLRSLDGELFVGLKNLYGLRLSNNKLSSLPPEIFKDLMNLEKLFLRDNQIKDIPERLFVGVNKLTLLSFVNNRLANLPMRIFQNLTNLQSLYLNDNMLSVLHEDLFKDLKSLINLYLHNNQITELNMGLFAGLNNLDQLGIYNNMVPGLPSVIFHDLTNLEELGLYNNKIPQLNEGLFRGLNNLKELWLAHNMLRVLEIGIFRDLISLRVLLLDNNELETLSKGFFDHLVKLERLYISFNQIKSLNDGLLFGLNILKTLDLHENMLETLPNHLFGRSTQLSKHLEFSGNITLIDLFLNDNNIRTIPPTFFSNMHNLEKLYLSGNELLLLNPILPDLKNMQLLILNSNKLVKLSNGVLNKLILLEIIHLASNKLNRLNANVFRGLINLETLYLQNNELTNLDSDIFKDTLNLTFIDLSVNFLQNIPNIRNLTYLNFFRLINNPLRWVDSSSFSSLAFDSELFVSQHEICDCYSPSYVKCSASDQRSPYLTCDRLLSDSTLAVAMWLIGINALGGNIFVLVWRIKNGQSKSVNSILLSSLATADMIMGIYMVIIASADIKFGENFPMQSETWRSGITCRIAGFLSIISSEASVFFVTLISIDRFICIRFPYSTRKIGKRSAVILVALTWITSCVLSIIPSILSGLNFKFYDNSHVCIGLPLALTKTYATDFKLEESIIREYGLIFRFFKETFTTELKGLENGLYYAIAVFLGLNCICYLIILACYVEILRAVKRSSKQARRSRDLNEQITLTAKVTAIVATDFCCWFPVIILGILVQMRVVSLPPSVYAWCVTFVLPINSAINPYLYTVSEIVSNLRKKQAKKTRQSNTPYPEDKRGPKAPTPVQHIQTENTAENKE